MVGTPGPKYQTPEVKPAPLSGGQGAGAAGSPVAGGAPTIAAETRAELDRLSTVLGYVAEARDRLNILCDDLVSAIVQVARSDNPEVGKKVRDWARLLEDTARMLLIAGKLVKEYWS